MNTKEKIKEVVSKAIKGGWKYYGEHEVTLSDKSPAVAKFNVDSIEFSILLDQAVIDPKFWEAVGKVEGWSEEVEYMGGLLHLGEKELLRYTEAQYKMHQMIDHVCSGGTIFSFIKNL